MARLRGRVLPAGVAAAALAVAIPAQGALAGGVGQAPAATKAPPAGGGYYGTWVQTSWDVDGTVLPCPVDLQLPPGAPRIGCAASTFLKLFRSGRYESNMPLFAANEADKGLFAVIAFGGRVGNAIVFDDYGTVDEPRSYRLVLPRSGGKPPKTMVISASMSMAGGRQMHFKMNFARYVR